MDGEMKYILDGGSLFQWLSWPRDTTFDSVCKIYVDYVTRTNKSPIIVFDGHGAGPSTKDITHLRRSGGKYYRSPSQLSWENLFANIANKQRFIIMLSEKLQDRSCRVRCRFVNGLNSGRICFHLRHNCHRREDGPLDISLLSCWLHLIWSFL